MKIHCLVHSALPGSTYLREWARRGGHIWERTLVPEAASLPRVPDVDCLVVVGGPMSVWEEDRHPWLIREKQLLRDFIDAEKPVLGICLGAQLLADVLGARTYRGPHQEIGWFHVEATPEGRDTWLAETLPPRFRTFLWHGDSFELPVGAVRLARSSAFENQGFIWNQCLALQFHLEVRPDWVRMLAERDALQLVPARYVQSADAILSHAEGLYRSNNALMARLLRRWLAHVRPRRA